MTYCFRFPTNNAFLCLHFKIWVENLFPLKGLSIIFSKLLFTSRAEILLSWITENKDVLSANSLAFEDNPSDKSLIYIKNNNGPSMEPWRTPVLTSDQSENCPFNKTLCFLFLRKSHKRFINCQIYHFLLI